MKVEWRPYESYTSKEMVLWEITVFGLKRMHKLAYMEFGHMTNNQAEACAVLQGLSLTHQCGIRKLLVFGDSTIIIRHMIHGTTPKDNKLAHFFSN